MTKLKIARGFSLDPDYVGSGTFALLAKKGAGKSYTARVMAEEMWDANIPFVLMDPMGTSWGLRASADGKGEGIPVAIFGGEPERADAPLERGAGKMIADLVVDEGLSMILDMSLLGSRAAEREFTLAFFDRLYRRNDSLVHLLVDEADLFAPQKPAHGDRPLLGMTENIVRRGRNRGIGITLITQRPAVLNKDVLTQIDGLVALRITGLTDREAIDKWVAGHGDDPELAAEVKGTLAGLENGESWWWIPELGILERVQVRKSHTFDSSPSRKRGQKARKPKGFADVDMGAIEQKMADTIERAKAEDPTELRKQVAGLKRDVAAKDRELAERPTEPVEVEKPVEVPVLANGAVDKLGAVVEAMAGVAEGVRMELARVADTREARRTPRRQRAEEPRSPAPAAVQTAPAASRPRSETPAAVADGDFTLDKATRAILTVLVQYPEGKAKRSLALLAGYSPRGGGFNNAMSRLRSAGLISSGGDPVTAAPEALNLVGDVEPLPTGAALFDYWMARLGKAEREILEVLFEAGGAALTKEEIAERTASGYSAGGGGFGNALSSLRTRELIDGRGEMRAAGVLFDG